MVERTLAIVKVMGVVCTTGIAAVDWTDSWPWAGVWIKGAELLRIVVKKSCSSYWLSSIPVECRPRTLWPASGRRLRCLIFEDALGL